MRRKRDKADERADFDNPEWTKAMFAKARPALEVLPEVIGAHAAADLVKRKPGRPVASSRKVVRTFRLPADVVAAYEATGTEWRQLVVQTLRDHMPGRR